MPREVKEIAYEGLVRLVLEYASRIGIPSGKTLLDELEKAQSRAASKNLEQLKWESLKQKRKGSRLILFYKCLKGQASIPVDDLKNPSRHTRNHHSKSFQIPYARTDAYRHSFLFTSLMRSTD